MTTAVFKINRAELCRAACRTALLIMVLAVPGFSQDRIEIYKNCPERWSGIRIVDPSGNEVFRACQEGWGDRDRTRFVHLTDSKVPDLFYATIEGAKLLLVSVYRKKGDVYSCIGQFAGFSVQPTVWNGRPAIQYEQLMPGFGRPEHFVYFVWNGRDFLPNENLDKSSYQPCSTEIRQER